MEASRDRQDLPALTGLRGVAAGLVVVGHFWAALRPTIVDSFWLWPFPPIGMAIFFTLSGYVIALSYGRWDWRARPLFNLCRLALYRFARLYPAFLLFAIVILLRNPPLRTPSTPEALTYVVDHLLLLQSWWPAKYDGQLVTGDLFSLSWSLSTEWALYLLFGLGAVLTARWHLHWVAKAVFFFALLSLLLVELWEDGRTHLAPAGWSGDDWKSWLFHISPLGVVMLFALGVASYRASLGLSDKAKRVASNAGALVLVGLYLALIVDLLRWSYGAALCIGLALALFMAGASARSLPNWLLSRSGIVYAGTVSYSLYLFHPFVAPIFQAGAFTQIDSWWVVNFATAVAVALMLATGIYAVVEEPGRRILRNAADRLLRIGRPAASTAARASEGSISSSSSIERTAPRSAERRSKTA